MKDYLYGLRQGLPICLGYIAVSFAFGVWAVNGLTPLGAILMSLSNLTSAGQFAGVKMILATSPLYEIAITVLLINLRYSLMSVSLSQKLDESVPTYQRLLFGFGVTDEVYAIAVTEKKKLSAAYMFGIITLPIVGWTLGTALGSFFASLFPDNLLMALNIALYAMFIAIIIPDAKHSLPICIVIAISIGLSCVFEYVPYVNTISVGLKIIIATVVAATIGALLFPVKDKEEK